MLESQQLISKQIIKVIQLHFTDKVGSLNMTSMTDLHKDISLSSLEMLILFTQLENQFNVDLFELGFKNEKYQSVGDIADIIHKQIKIIDT